METSRLALYNPVIGQSHVDLLRSGRKSAWSIVKPMLPVMLFFTIGVPILVMGVGTAASFVLPGGSKKNMFNNISFEGIMFWVVWVLACLIMLALYVRTESRGGAAKLARRHAANVVMESLYALNDSNNTHYETTPHFPAEAWRRGWNEYVRDEVRQTREGNVEGLSEADRAAALSRQYKPLPADVQAIWNKKAWGGALDQDEYNKLAAIAEEHLAERDELKQRMCAFYKQHSQDKYDSLDDELVRTVMYNSAEDVERALMSKYNAGLSTPAAADPLDRRLPPPPVQAAARPAAPSTSNNQQQIDPATLRRGQDLFARVQQLPYSKQEKVEEALVNHGTTLTVADAKAIIDEGKRIPVIEMGYNDAIGEGSVKILDRNDPSIQERDEELDPFGNMLREDESGDVGERFYRVLDEKGLAVLAEYA